MVILEGVVVVSELEGYNGLLFNIWGRQGRSGKFCFSVFFFLRILSFSIFSYPEPSFFKGLHFSVSTSPLALVEETRLCVSLPLKVSEGLSPAV